MIKVPFYPLEKNKDKVLKYFGEEFFIKSMNDILTVNESLYANDLLMDIIYGKELATLIRKRDYESVKELYLSTYKRRIANKESLKGIDMEDIGIVMIRPETLGLCKQYEELLKSKGLQIIFEKMIHIDFEQYWILYQHGLIHYDCRYDFPTRTFNYVDNDCKLYVVTSNIRKENNYSISSYLKLFKGKQGKYTQGTLRGDIAYNALKEYIQDDKLTPKMNIILDPIGMYRAITRGQLDYDRAHEVATIPLLFYAGQAIHIPDDEEIEKDFRTLCTEDEILMVKEKILTLKKGI